MVDCNSYTFTSSCYKSVVNEAIIFFEGRNILEFPVENSFKGAGVYALYYKGGYERYNRYYEWNASSYKVPIYVGKAVPSGWRKARTDINLKISTSLPRRLKEHAKTISSCEDFDLQDFRYRFIILNNEESDLIGTLESTLIRKYQPLWNKWVDGFGNHNPGKGRYNQAMSEWDVLHVGRSWAKLCTGKPPEKDGIYKNIGECFSLKFF